MPRKGRIDAPGALYHIVARGIARKKIFDDDVDMDFFMERLGMIVRKSQTQLEQKARVVAVCCQPICGAGQATGQRV